MLEELFKRFRQRDRLALSRLVTLAARGEQVLAIRESLRDYTAARPATTAHSPLTTHHSPLTIAITGSGGVGKSSLIGRLIELLRSHGQTVAVLACDPQSSLTGGALLGDRIRMPSRPEDDGVFIRSLAVPSGHEGIAPNLDLMIRLLAEYGFDLVLVETSGIGQTDTAVRRVADVVVLLLQPETGDELQWQKAGVLEVADVVVVHKADLPGAERVEAQVRDMVNLPGCRAVPVLRASASKGQGMEELWHAIESFTQNDE